MRDLGAAMARAVRSAHVSLAKVGQGLVYKSESRLKGVRSSLLDLGTCLDKAHCPSAREHVS